MTTYFSDKTFKFLRGIARHNHREWFLAHKADYETSVRAPFLQLLLDLQPALAQVSEHYRADPRPTGGSLFRLHRDTRFARDKTPYKRWQGARLFHARGREVEAPSFYLHLEPGACFVGAGLWHPESTTQRKLRQFIFENPGSWETAAHAPAFRKRYDLESSDALVRPPRGFPADFRFIDDLKRRNFVAVRMLPDKTMLGSGLRQVVEKDLHALAPFVDYLCAALDLEF
jgi:uncharacterized protein (TIGR02453 family)